MRLAPRFCSSVDEPLLMVDYTLSGSRTLSANGAFGDPFGSHPEAIASPCERWAHQNRLGTVVATTNSAGAVAERFVYGPYGEVQGSTAGFPFRFTGQKLDPGEARLRSIQRIDRSAERALLL